MNVYPIGIQSGYILPSTGAEPAGGVDLPQTTVADTITKDTSRPHGNDNPTYDRNGKMNTASGSEETRDSDQTSRPREKSAEQSSDDAARVRELKRTDRHVRAHEMAHLAAGAGLVKGGAKYTYKQGPDGNLYAVAGEVSIDTSEGGTPRETIVRMQRVKAAALAPSDPSPQDRSVAAAATAKAARAAVELAMERTMQATGMEGKQDAGKSAMENKGLAAYRKSVSSVNRVGKTASAILAVIT